MFGKNPKRSPVQGDGRNLNIQEIFKTFQGEGPYVGHPAIFVRLGGCNLACSFCDTEFESFENISCEEIIENISNLSINSEGVITHSLVVITGGEPFLQPIERFCDLLLANGYKVQIETNGTLYRDLADQVDIICSPKNQGKGYYGIRPDLLARVNAFKFIISKNNPDYNNISDVGQIKNNIPVYVQPMDEYNPDINKENMEYVIDLANKNGYRISIQTHKVLGIE